MKNLIAVLTLSAALINGQQCECPENSVGILVEDAAIPAGGTCSDIGTYDVGSQCNTIIDICCDGGGEVIDPEEEEATTEEGEIDEEVEGEEDPELSPEIPDVTPCPVCTGGLTVDGSTGAGGGNTCDDLLADAQQVDESSDECTAMKGAESRCCPPPPENPCTVCSGGLTVDESVGLGGGRTCGGLLIDAVSTEEDSDVCTQMKSVEETCCPAVVENPCAVCADGVTGEDAEGVDCEQVLEEALLIEDGTDACSLAKDAESICCPAVIEQPCDFCGAIGITVDEDSPTSVEGFTCSDVAREALLVEEESTSCPLFKAEEAICCASTVVDPCSVCESGITADLSTVVGNEKTCADILIDAALLEADSPSCALMKDTELSCCPEPAENPCAVCVNGLSVEESVEIGSGKTCGDLLVDAINTEEDSDTCTIMKNLGGDTCCPVAPTITPVTTNAPTVTPPAVSSILPTIGNTTNTLTWAPTVVIASSSSIPTVGGDTVPDTSAPVALIDDIAGAFTESPVFVSTELPVPSTLEDNNENCSAWAAAGECLANPDYMNSVCALSCATAGGTSASKSLTGSRFTGCILTALVYLVGLV